MAGKMKPRYFLVFFKHGRNDKPESDVLHQKRIPDGYGTHAKVNDCVRIKYKEDKIVTFYDGIILQIDHDQNVLQSVDVDENGEIMPPNQKRFPGVVVALKRHLAQESKAIQVAAKEHQRNLDNSLLQMSGFNAASASDCSKNLSPNCVTASPLQSDSRLVTPAGCSKDLSVNDVTAQLLPSISHLVTPSVKMFLEALVPAASALHDSSQCAQVDWLHSVLQNILRSVESEQEKNLSVPGHFRKKSKECDTDLFGNGKFFVPFMTYRSIHADVENRASNKVMWEVYVAEVLNRLYGNRLLYVTAKGLRETKGIDADLYKCLLDYCTNHCKDFSTLKKREPAFNRRINLLSQGRRNMKKNKTTKRKNGAAVTKKVSKGNKKQCNGNKKQSKGDEHRETETESEDEDDCIDVENQNNELQRTSSMDDGDLLTETPIREKLQQQCHGSRVVGENNQLLERKGLQPIMSGKRKISKSFPGHSSPDGPHLQKSQIIDLTEQVMPGQAMPAAVQNNQYHHHQAPHAYNHGEGSPAVSSGQGNQTLFYNQFSRLSAPAYYSNLPQEGAPIYGYATRAGSSYVANSGDMQSVQQYPQDPVTEALQIVNNSDVY